MKTLKHLCIVILLLITSIETNAQIKVLTNGNVGIDETNPVCKLSIGTEGYINAKAYIYNSNTANGSRALQGYQNPNSSGYCYGLVGSIKYGTYGYKMVGTYGSAYRGSTPGGGRTYGLYGIAGNASDGYNYGVRAYLLGTRNGASIFAVTPGKDDVNVLGIWAGYFRGDVYIEDDLDVDGIFSNSDLRLKKNIRNLDVNNISKLKQLQGIKYKLKHPSEMDDFEETLSDTVSIESLLSDLESEKYTKDRIGLIAQDIQKVFPELIKVDHKDYLKVDYIGLIPILVEAIKEQQMIIENLVSDISALKSESSGNLKSALIISDNNLSEQTGKPILYQNIPNPFFEDTEIRFYIPAGVNDARIYLYNMQGNQLRSMAINQCGEGKEIIHGNDIQAGMYIYTLIVDGHEVDTKRMILTK